MVGIRNPSKSLFNSIEFKEITMKRLLGCTCIAFIILASPWRDSKLINFLVLLSGGS